MNPDEVSARAIRLAAQLERLRDVSSVVDRAVLVSLNPLSWGVQPGGPIIAPMSVAGCTMAAILVRQAVSEAERSSQQLFAEVEAQLRVSGGGGSRIPGGGVISSAPLAAVVALLRDSAGHSPEAINAAWAALSADERATLMAQYPELVGSADGVPLLDRIAANRIVAQNYLDSGVTMGSDQRRYIEQVASGDRQLVLFDPAGERIIELEGTLTAETHTVITYVPGTDANMNSFYTDASSDASTQANSVHQVARYQVNRDLTGGTVALVYKDGPWVVWPWADVDRANNNDDFLGRKGEELARFQQGVSTDSMVAGARSIAIAHSAGMTVVGESETSGAHYDQVHSLAGSYLPDDWSPRDGTSYSHYQYGVDAINALDAVKSQTPNTSGAFENVQLDADRVRLPWGAEVNDPAESHSRIARGPSDGDGGRGNLAGLEEMRERIRFD